ncbi:MerR family transcriptional regulator [Arthrobacter crusticola]|uniref:MerR family transcriptional regulator n=1 Tax=Arthrobacter crusticola TaxID=2547960 RepID=A0A4R5TQG9_9MICC|nr:MerR family transcriptional regulator [Arthrobacter crusticola]TDK23675.1 MerR family transcriptional regulator [Arthrobacter crusticola]
MGWSTREIADLAGTTVNTVRHYHQIGLLEQPDRMSNGYKQYQVRHLVRLLRIRRLRDLGVPLDQIDQVAVDGDSSAEALRAIDSDLRVSIERLQRARAEIQAILHGSSLTDVPPGFEDVGAQMSEADRSLVLIYSQLYNEEAMSDLRDMQEAEGELSADLDALAPDADESVRQELAERYAPTIAKALKDYSWLSDPKGHVTKSAEVTRDTVVEAIQALYNPAQRDVIARASIIANGLLLGADPPAEGEGPTP